MRSGPSSVSSNGIRSRSRTTRRSSSRCASQDKRDRDWYVKKAEERAKREEARLRRVAAQDAVDLLGAWVRDLWVVACGASDVLWNCDRADELARAAVATPEYYARLMGVVARTRKDLYLNIDQKLALQALFARFEEVAESA